MTKKEITVFDSIELNAEIAKRLGITPEQYRRNNPYNVDWWIVFIKFILMGEVPSNRSIINISFKENDLIYENFENITKEQVELLFQVWNDIVKSFGEDDSIYIQFIW